MLLSMVKNVKTIRAKNAVSAGTTTQTCTFDTTGFRGIEVTVLFGTLTSTTAPVITLYSGAVSDGSDKAAISGATLSVADTESNKAFVLDALNMMPDGKKYMTVEVTRPTANAVIDGIIAKLYNPINAPVTQDTTVSNSVLVAG